VLFNSYAFIFLFLPVTLLVWHVIARRAGPAPGKVVLLLASLVFYGLGGLQFLGLLLGSMVFDFLITRQIGDGGASPIRKKILLVLGLVANLGLLGYFKYAGFFVANVNALLGTDWPLLKLVLPLGISFYTFQKVGYLVDVYRGITKPCGFTDYCLFVSFFPQLIAGPIVHHSELLPQFRNRENRGCSAAGMAEGVTMFTIGLAKKVLIADGLSASASRVFAAAAHGADFSTADAWLGLLAYTFQIYFDFSGYSDMAIGLGLMFGVKLPFNFDSPYSALSISAFWRRWHITLSNFIRDYLFIPFGGSRVGQLRACFNFALVMAIAGLWHGANWTFVAWGTLHGLALAVYFVWRKTADERITLPPTLAWLGTFAFVALTWVLFRADNLATAGRIYAKLFDFGAGPGGPPLVKPRFWVYAVLLVAAVRWLPNSQNIVFHTASDEAPPGWWLRLAWRPNTIWACLLALLFAACVLSLSNVSEFLYWQF
jgi:alginate O-acetyltransferase complex protein AlgI